MSRYTKAHYEQLARIVCATAYECAERMPDREDTARREANARTIREGFARRLAVSFAHDNARFDADKWFEACGVQR